MSGVAPLVVPALTRATSCVLVMHGLGDSGAGWYFLAEDFRRRSLFPETKFIFPNAPTIPITWNMGMRMPGWYDIADLTTEDDRIEDEEGILRSQKVIHALIAEEVKNGIPPERIVVGGFSQGGAMSLLAGLTHPTRLGGIFGLSCYLLLRGKIRDMIPADSPNKNTKIFMGHGDADPVVQYRWGKKTAELLNEWGFDVDFQTYKDIPHSAAPREIEDLAKYLQERIPEIGDKSA